LCIDLTFPTQKVVLGSMDCGRDDRETNKDARTLNLARPCKNSMQLFRMRRAGWLCTGSRNVTLSMATTASQSTDPVMNLTRGDDRRKAHAVTSSSLCAVRRIEPCGGAACGLAPSCFTSSMVCGLRSLKVALPGVSDKAIAGRACSAWHARFSCFGYRWSFGQFREFGDLP
jgi:hypothetical protein